MFAKCSNQFTIEINKKIKNVNRNLQSEETNLIIKCIMGNAHKSMIICKEINKQNSFLHHYVDVALLVLLVQRKYINLNSLTQLKQR